MHSITLTRNSGQFGTSMNYSTLIATGEELKDDVNARAAAGIQPGVTGCPIGCGKSRVFSTVPFLTVISKGVAGHQENNTMLGWLEMLESTRLAKITRSSFKILKKFL